MVDQVSDADKPVVLIVDDDENMCGLLAYKLKQNGYAVEIAVDGFEAREKLLSRRFAVVLLDIMMPKMDGFQLMRELNEKPEVKPDAIIVLSARKEETDILLAFDLGAVDYVTKPFSLNVLVARVGIALRYKHN